MKQVPFKAYKGFNKDLKCKDHQFVIGEIAEKPHVDKPRLCTADGFHYCNKLEEVFAHYSFNDTNRFCEIEVLGAFTETTGYDAKGTTTMLKVIREITKEQILESRLYGNMKLDTVRKIQTKFPLWHVGGSIGLYLHGCRLSRWGNKDVGDIDMVAPYFEILDGFGDDTSSEYLECKKSGNDFDEVFIVDSVKVDCRIDPKQRYVIIEHKGFKYKVSTFETIMAAKMKYAMNGQQKHKEDIRELCGVGKPVPIIDFEIPF